MTNYNEGDEVCGYCLGNRSGIPFTDLLKSARWRGTCPLSRAAFFARFARPHHPLVDSILVTQYFYRQDWMHTYNCNGVDSTAIGSVLPQRGQYSPERTSVHATLRGDRQHKNR